MAPTVIGRKSSGSIRTAGVSAPQSMPSVSGSRLRWGVCRRPSGVLRGEGSAKATEGGFSLVQLSDSHIGLGKFANPGARPLQPETFGFPQVSAGVHRGFANSRILPGWICLEFLGFSRQKRAFSMGYKRPGANFNLRGPLSSSCAASARTSAAPTPSPGGKGSWQSTSRGSDRALGSDYGGPPFFATNCRRDIILRKSS